MDTPDAEFLDRGVSGFAPEQGDYRKFVIVSAPRTGSTHLASLLRSHPKVICYSELFHPLRVVLGPQHKILPPEKLLAIRDRDPAGFMRAVLNTRYAGHIRAVGFKVLYQQARRGRGEEMWERLAEEPDLVAIHLVRDNLLAAYCSILAGQKTGQWSANHAEQLENTTVRVDYDSFRKAVSEMQAEQRRMRKWVRRLDHVDLSYEQLLTNRYEATKTVFDALGLPNADLKSESLRQNTGPLSQRIENYQELERRLRGTVWHHWLAD